MYTLFLLNTLSITNLYSYTVNLLLYIVKSVTFYKIIKSNSLYLHFSYETPEEQIATPPLPKSTLVGVSAAAAGESLIDNKEDEEKTPEKVVSSI